MADILQTAFRICIFLYENCGIAIQISLKFVAKGPIDKRSALAQVMAWRLFGAKPLPEPMMTQFTDGIDPSPGLNMTGL